MQFICLKCPSAEKFICCLASVQIVNMKFTRWCRFKLCYAKQFIYAISSQMTCTQSSWEALSHLPSALWLIFCIKFQNDGTLGCCSFISQLRVEKIHIRNLSKANSCHGNLNVIFSFVGFCGRLKVEDINCSLQNSTE